MGTAGSHTQNERPVPFAGPGRTIPSSPAVAVIGFGEPGKGDAAAGPSVIDALRRSGLYGADLYSFPEPRLEHAQTIAGFSTVVFIDVDGPGEMSTGIGSDIRRLRSSDGARVGSRPFSPTDLLSVCGAVYGKEPESYMCMISGENFSEREGMSASVQQRVIDAAERIASFLAGNEATRPGAPARESRHVRSRGFV